MNDSAQLENGSSAAKTPPFGKMLLGEARAGAAGLAGMFVGVFVTNKVPGGRPDHPGIAAWPVSRSPHE